MGSLVLLVHDVSDHWLELGKMAKYARREVIVRVEKSTK
jgi:hypothetical protein